MLKSLMKNGITVFAAVGVMALAGCGEKSGNGGGNAAAPAGTDAVTDDHSDADHSHDGDAGDSGGAPAAGAGGGSVAFDDSSAEAAINTYVNRLKAGDFIGAAEVCLAEAPGTEKLTTIGEKFIEMENSLEDASIGATAKAIFTDDFKTMEIVKTLEEEGIVVYEVAVINKAPVNIRVENRDGVWRVIPPIGGTPIG